MRYLSVAGTALLLLGAGCASGRGSQAGASPPAAPSPTTTQDTGSADRAQYASTYQRRPNPPVLIRNATIMTATGQEIANGAILLRDGRIIAVGATVDAPGDATVV